MLDTKFQSHSIKIEDFKLIPINLFNPISTKGVSEIFETNTRIVLNYAQEVRFQVLEK